MPHLNLQNNLPTGSAGFWQRLSACTIEIASRRYQVPQYMGVLDAVGGSAANQMRELLSVLCSICARVVLAAESPECNMSQRGVCSHTPIQQRIAVACCKSLSDRARLLRGCRWRS